MIWIEISLIQETTILAKTLPQFLFPSQILHFFNSSYPIFGGFPTRHSGSFKAQKWLMITGLTA